MLGVLFYALVAGVVSLGISYGVRALRYLHRRQEDWAPPTLDKARELYPVVSSEMDKYQDRLEKRDTPPDFQLYDWSVTSGVPDVEDDTVMVVNGRAWRRTPKGYVELDPTAEAPLCGCNGLHSVDGAAKAPQVGLGSAPGLRAQEPPYSEGLGMDTQSGLGTGTQSGLSTDTQGEK